MTNPTYVLPYAVMWLWLGYPGGAKSSSFNRDTQVQ
jgi:hypothetical protein